MGFGPRGEHQGDQADVHTQQLNVKDLEKNRQRTRGEESGDDIDVAAAVQARKEFDATSSPEDLARENEMLEKFHDVGKESLTDVGRDRAARVGQKISSAGKGLGRFFGGLMEKLKGAGAGLFYGTMAAPEAIGRATAATKEGVGHARDVVVDKAAAAAAATRDAAVKGGKAVGKGAAVVGGAVAMPVVGGAMLAAEGVKRAAGAAKDIGEIGFYGSIAAAEVGADAAKAVGRGIKKGAESVSEGAKAVGRGARDVAEIGVMGALAGIDSGIDAVKGGAKAVARGAKETSARLAGGARDIAFGTIEKAKDTWGNLQERGQNLLDSLTARKNSVIDGFLNWRHNRLERKALEAQASLEKHRARVQGQRQALETVAALEPESPTEAQSPDAPEQRAAA